MNKISFIPFTKEAFLGSSIPVPSNKFIPDWYKSISPFTNGDKKVRFPIENGMPNSSLKKCVPFLDAMTAGYMAVLDDDIHIENVNGMPFIRWRGQDVQITTHSFDQFEGFPIPEYYYPAVAKFHNDWGIEIPKGYSIYFTHPSNRFDLPFTTISGFVDCDKYNNPVQFPFLLKYGFEGIIPSGTPVAQLLLVKRESWKSQKESFDQDKIYIKRKNFFKTFVGSYKKNYWSRKNYE